MPSAASLRDAYRARKGDKEHDDSLKVPQSFTFMAREGRGSSHFIVYCMCVCVLRLLSFYIQLVVCMCLLWAGLPGQGNGLQLEETIPRRLRSEGKSRDIFAMVKLSMSDGILSQPPLCVYPESLLQSTEIFFNGLNSTTSILTQSLDESRAADLSELASVIEADYPHMVRSVRYLRQITNSDRPRAPYTPLQFIAAGPQANAGVGNVQLGRPAPVPKPHKLRVVFHHRA